MKKILIPMGFEQLTDLSASIGITASLAGKGNVALLQAQTQNVRFRDDGTDPTATVGMLMIAGATYYEYRGDLSKIRFIEAVAGGVLNISVYREG